MSPDTTGHIPHIPIEEIPRFDRQFFDSDQLLSRIGGGSIGGKASGLVFANRVLTKVYPEASFEGLQISIPRFVVIGTDVYDAFMDRNDLRELAADDLPDDRMALAFLKADFPAEFSGDLRALISTVHSPLAVRSSSLLEDALYEPFAGVYGTKMIPNNQPDTDTRYKKLIEAIKFVYASASFREAKGYFSMTGRSIGEEKMAVIIQEVVGERHDDRFYPHLAGVGRSYNFYPVGGASPNEGVVELCLGLGKSIVDGEKVWAYSPAYPRVSPPFTTKDLLANTQTRFWAVNMGKPPAFDPVKEAEYMVMGDLRDAEKDRTLDLLVSTYDAANDRLVMGTGRQGARVLDFAPLLRLDTVPFNDVTERILKGCHDMLGAPVEIELATVLGKDHWRFCLLQVRPMVVSDEQVDITDSEMSGDQALLASENTLGNGVVDDVTDIIYVKHDLFSKEHTRQIAGEINQLNGQIDTKYLLIGFGRWGSSDHWLGIPVDWGNISRARAIVEATLPDMNVEMSQGSHFFHNITSLQIPYLNVSFTGDYRIDWEWLDSLKTVRETPLVRHVCLETPITIKVDGRSRRGVILK